VISKEKSRAGFTAIKFSGRTSGPGDSFRLRAGVELHIQGRILGFQSPVTTYFTFLFFSTFPYDNLSILAPHRTRRHLSLIGKKGLKMSFPDLEVHIRALIDIY